MCNGFHKNKRVSSMEYRGVRGEETWVRNSAFFLVIS